MVVDLDNTFRKMMTKIMIMMINMMMKIKMVITWPIIELGDPNFAW